MVEKNIEKHGGNLGDYDSQSWASLVRELLPNGRLAELGSSLLIGAVRTSGLR